MGEKKEKTESCDGKKLRLGSPASLLGKGRQIFSECPGCRGAAYGLRGAGPQMGSSCAGHLSEKAPGGPAPGEKAPGTARPASPARLIRAAPRDWTWVFNHAEREASLLRAITQSQRARDCLRRPGHGNQKNDVFQSKGGFLEML